VITKVGGKPVDDPDDLRTIAGVPTRASVDVEVVRDGREARVR
jgi:S1-C subfamily serine protease